jgi:adenylate cyclase
MNLPLRISLTTAFVVFTALVITVIASLNFTQSKGRILEAAKVRMNVSASTAEDEVNRLFNRAFTSSEAIASLPVSVFNLSDFNILEGVLTSSLRNANEIYGAFVGFSDGSFVQAINFIAADGSKHSSLVSPDNAAIGWRIIKPIVGSDDRLETWRFFDLQGVEILDFPNKQKIAKYDPRVRPWYISALKKGQTNASDAYVFESLRQPGVTVSTPIHTVPGAVVGVDLPLKALAHLTNRIKSGNNGTVAIFKQDGAIIAYPDYSKILKNAEANSNLELSNVESIDDPRLNAAKLIFDRSKESEASFTIGDENYIAFIKDVAQKNDVTWKFMSVAAVSDFTESLFFDRTLIITALIMGFAVFCVAVLAEWIAAPIVRLRNMADKITEMNLAQEKQFDSPFIEINSLQKSMEQMRSALSVFIRYVPRELVRDQILSGQPVEIGGRRREVTLLFTDIEGFTGLTERMTPEEVMTQTSVYFEQLAFAIQANRGTIDKFIGDAIMAIWNAPTDDPHHVDNACRGTLTAFSLSEDLNKDLVLEGSPPMRTRFGLHTGEALVGNMGARDRMQYTCLGANVNLASRIEGMNKQYGTSILVSDAVRRKASRDFVFRRVDIVEAKGTSLPVTVYELLGERQEGTAFFVGHEVLKSASKYEEAFDFYLHRDFSDAMGILDQLAVESPEDGVVNALREKCRYYLDAPPPASWNGVTAIKEK